MKYIVALLVILALCLFAFAQTQPPTNLTAVEQVGQANLGSVLNWDKVTGATYSIYADRGSYDCGGIPKFTLIATGVTTTTYTDEPSNPPLPLGAGECYTVTAVVGGVESAKSNQADTFIGNKLYFTASYDNVACSMKGASLVVYQNLNGTVTEIVNEPDHVSGAFGGHVRLLDAATYYATLTLPDGKVFNYNPLFSAGQQLSAIESSFNSPQFHCGTDLLTHLTVQTTLEPTVN